MTPNPTSRPADTTAQRPLFRRRLLAWYGRQRRDLPWRRDRNPYHVWLSEIMLQQTRVAAVIEYYERFLRRFPTVKKLAVARPSSVLAAWSGLGYYLRARMLHQAAKKVVKERGGEFPARVEELQQLPGIGRYTAAAIASIAFGDPVAVVDGNVERVLQRLLGQRLGGDALWRSAQELLNRRRPGDFNQAMMELGATVCLPRQPRCLVCPVFDFCVTRGDIENPAQEVRRKRRRIQYALDCRDSKVFMVRRPKAASLMPGMWELPETAQAMKQNGLTLRHSITVTDYLVRVSRSPAPAGTVGQWIPRMRLASLPLTGLARKILRAAEVI